MKEYKSNIEHEEMVSVIIPTFNRDICYISRAIKSIIKQTYKNFEIIVVDDNSIKTTYSQNIKKFCISHNIKYIKTNGQEGANKARNIGALYAKGSYLAFLDDDDMWLSNKLKVQLNHFSIDTGLVYTNGYVVSSKSKWLYTPLESFTTDGNIYKLLLYNYIGPTVSGLIRKECFFDVGMFDENMPSKQDYDLWIRIAAKYKIVGINQPLFLYTQHNSYQMTKDYNLILKGYFNLYKKYHNFFENDFILNFFFYLKIAKIHKSKNNYFKYYHYIYCALKSIMNESLNTIF